MNPELLISTRTRSTPFTNRVDACGVKAYTVYNHMLLPAIFRSLEEDYWHLCKAVQVWDVSCQRQVEITGKDGNDFFGEEKQLIEIRKIFDEFKLIKPKNITPEPTMVQESKTETNNPKG